MHFLIDAHLLLRVKDVELAVRGHQTRGELARIVNVCLPRTAFLGGDDDNATHGARTVYGRCRAVFQYLKALDVVRVEAGNGRRDKRFGISRRQRIGTNVGNVFLYNAVYNPQRLRVAIDRGGSAHVYFRCRAERSRHVLHAHAGRTAFQRAANVCHAAYQGIVGLNLVGRTGKHSAVHVRHTRYHNLVQGLVVWRQRYFHCGLGA